MTDATRIVLTGGGGRLGGEIKRLLPGIVTPDLPDFDVCNADQVENMLDEYRPDLVIHAAAYTNVAGGGRPADCGG